MVNETVRRGIKNALRESEIDCNKIQFSKIGKLNGEIISIDKMIITLNIIDGVAIDKLKSTVNDFLENNNINYNTLYLDI